MKSLSYREISFGGGGIKKGKLFGLVGIVCESLRGKEVCVSKILESLIRLY